MKQNKLINVFIAIIFSFSTTLNASIPPNSQLLQSNLNSVSIEKINNINITTNSLNLISYKNTNSHTEFKSKSGIMTATITDKGKITEVEIPAIIRVNDKFILNGKDISGKLDTKTYNQISNSLNSQEFKENIIKELSSNSQIPLNDTTINQIKATLNSKEWNDKTTTLSGIGSLIITAVVTYLTAGAGSALSGALSTAGASATTATTTTAITSAVTTNLSLQTTNYIISNGKVKFDLDSLTKSAISAGIGSLASSYISGIEVLNDTTLNPNNSNFLNLNANNSLNFSYQNFAKTALNSVTNAGIQSGIYGTSFKDSLIANLTNSLGDNLYNVVGDIAFTQSEINNNDYFKEGSLGKVALHATTGGIASKLMGDKFEVGAISAGLNEALSPLFSKDTSSMSKEELTKYNTQRLAISQLIGTISGGMINGDTGANTAFTISTSAALNNRQLHQREIDFINDQENINAVKSLLEANGKSYSKDEAKSILAKAAVSLDDSSFNQAYKDTLSSDELNNINLAKEFIKSSSFYNTDLGDTKAFNPTIEQYNDRYGYLDTFINNQDFYKQNLKVNTSYLDNTLGFMGGTLKGGVNLVKDTITGAYYLAADPIQAGKGIVDTVLNADTLIYNGLMKSELDLMLGDYSSATARDFEFMAGLTGSGVVTKKAGKATIDKVGDIALKPLDDTFNNFVKSPDGISDVGKLIKETEDGAIKTNTPNGNNNLNSNANTNNNGIVVAEGSDTIKNKNTSNPLENIEYTDKVKKQIEIGDYHSFPEIVEAFGKDAKISKIQGKDGLERTKVEIEGSYKGKNGVFEYIIEQDGKTVNHRLFVPYKEQ